ncbi:MAG: T9SS type A sorting domain-containing protein, partial [Bacteroidota bacterium]
RPASGQEFILNYIAWNWHDIPNFPKQDFQVSVYSHFDGFTDPIIDGISRPNDTDQMIWQNNNISNEYFADVSTFLRLRVYFYAPTNGIGGAPVTSGSFSWDDFYLGGFHQPAPDCDNDGVANSLDLDLDNDGLPDIIEAIGVDVDGDGLVDYPTPGDPSSMVDADNDGLDDARDNVDNGSGAGEVTSGTAWWLYDTDQDNRNDYYDLDSDQDGIPDLVETGGIDSNGDGRVDNYTDADGDGFSDQYDPDDDGIFGVEDSTDPLIMSIGTAPGSLTYQSGSNSFLLNMDGDGVRNSVDLDADNDGITDIIEAGGTDSNRDGMADGSTDADNDGLLDTYDANASDGYGGTGTNGSALMTVATDGVDADNRLEYTAGSGIADTDGDDVPDFLDADSDNDGIYDMYEAQATNGFTPISGNDNDGDGVDNAFDDNDGSFGGNGNIGTTPNNHDSDALPDYRDIDTDGDGVPDLQEAWDALDDGDSRPDAVAYADCFIDSDGDGVVDAFDTDDADLSDASINITPPDDDGTGGRAASFGIDLTSNRDVDQIFPNNALGASNSEPDWRDGANAVCATAATIYALTDAGTTVEWNPTTQIHEDNAGTGIIRATALCEAIGGWYRFYNPLEPDNYLFAIQNGTNTNDLRDVIDYIEIEVESAPVFTRAAEDGFGLLPRSWKVVTKGSLNGTVNIRFYFTSSEYADFISSATTMANDIGTTFTTEWFKTDSGVDFNNVPSESSMYQIDNYIELDTALNGLVSGQSDNNAGGNSRNYVQVDGLSSFSGGTIGAEMEALPLPVEWLAFGVKLQGNDAQLDWSTANEVDASMFLIERSIDGTNFVEIGTEGAKGTGQGITHYEFTDKGAAQIVANKVFYRLQEIDLNGTRHSSNVIELRLPELEKAVWFTLKPVPANQHLTIQYRVPVGTGQLEIVSLLGQRIYQQQIDGTEGSLSIPVQAFAAGYYYLKIKSLGQQKVQKFQIVH